MFTVLSLPLILRPSVLLTGVQSLQHYDNPGAPFTAALSMLVLGFWGSWNNSAVGNTVWRLRADLVLNEGVSSFEQSQSSPRLLASWSLWGGTYRGGGEVRKKLGLLF